MGFGVSSPSWQQLTKETMVSWLIMLFLSQAFGNEIIAPQQPVHHGYDTAGSRILVSGHTGPLTIYPIAAGASYQHHTPYLHVAPAHVYHVEEPVHHVTPAHGVSAPVYHVEEPVHHVEPAHVPAPVYHVEEPVHHVAPTHGVPTPVYHVEEPVHHAAPAPVYHVERAHVAPVIVAPLYDQHQEVPNVHPDDVTEHVEVEDADAENYQDKREGSSLGFIPLVNSDRYEDPVNLHGYSEFVEQVMDYVH